MEKWKTKGRNNNTGDSLLPPSRRVADMTPLRADKKKEKKWSIGGFLRRISAIRDSSSSSDEEDTSNSKKRVLSKKKLKISAVTKPATDIVILQPVPRDEAARNTNKEPTTLTDYRESNSYISQSQNSLNLCRDSLHSRSSDGSLDGAQKKSRKEKIKARVEAKRDQLGANSSSDEDSHKSSNSLVKFRSDDSIQSLQKGDLNGKRTRSARTERFLKRLSREECSAESNNNSLKSNPRSESTTENDGVVVNHLITDRYRPPIHPRLNSQLKSQTLTTYPDRGTATTDPQNCRSHAFCSENCLSNQSQSQSDVSSFDKRFLGYFTDVNKSPTLKSEKKVVTNPSEHRRRHTDVVDVATINKLRAPRNSQSTQRVTPPEPPPRDPQRSVLSFGSYDTARPSSCAFDLKQPVATKRVNGEATIVNRKSPQSAGKAERCYNSNDEIAWYETVPPAKPRPSSVNSQMMHNHQEPSRRKYPSSSYHFSDEDKRAYQSRTPYRTANAETTSMEPSKNQSSESESSTTFARGLDKPTSPSSKYGSHSFQKNAESANRSRTDEPDSGQTEAQVAQKAQTPPVPPIRRSSYVSSLNAVKNCEVDVGTRKRNSKNLEEALSELEAIYNSLRLGDEDLLERAEQRTMEEFQRGNKLKELPKSSSESASNESLKEDGSTKPYLVKPEIPDRLKDDMAYRRMNPKERPSSLDGQASLSKISYLFTSPILSRKEMEYMDPKNKARREEPDVTRDDVVYRSISYTNNILRVIEPQPPFGIPLGPVSSATDSDYLHSVPNTSEPPRSPYIPKSEPNVVTDDLAYRNLRKDSFKNGEQPTSPPPTRNDNTTFGIKKKRAVRSLSANLYRLINRQGSTDEGNQSERQPPNARVFTNNANNSIAKDNLTDDNDEYLQNYRTRGMRHVVSDTESSGSGVHWSRPTDAGVDINGNRAKNVYRRKLQVYIPQRKENSLYISGDAADPISPERDILAFNGETKKPPRSHFAVDKYFSDENGSATLRSPEIKRLGRPSRQGLDNSYVGDTNGRTSLKKEATALDDETKRLPRSYPATDKYLSDENASAMSRSSEIQTRGRTSRSALDNLYIGDASERTSLEKETTMAFDNEEKKSPLSYSSTEKYFSDESGSALSRSPDVKDSPARIKDTEPFTEQEISKYKQLCQDLENLVQLAKGERAQTIETSAETSSRDGFLVEVHPSEGEKKKADVDRVDGGSSSDYSEEKNSVVKGKIIIDLKSSEERRRKIDEPLASNDEVAKKTLEYFSVNKDPPCFERENIESSTLSCSETENNDTTCDEIADKLDFTEKKLVGNVDRGKSRSTDRDSFDKETDLNDGISYVEFSLKNTSDTANSRERGTVETDRSLDREAGEERESTASSSEKSTADRGLTENAKAREVRNSNSNSFKEDQVNCDDDEEEISAPYLDEEMTDSEKLISRDVPAKTDAKAIVQDDPDAL